MTQLRLGLLARSQLVMSGVALSLTAVSCFTTMAPSRAQSVLPQITGEFVGSGCPKGDLGCVPTVTSDKVNIFRTRVGELRVSIRIAFDRGQSCRLDATADLVDDAVKIHADGINPDQPCELILRRSGRALTLEDAGQHCREVYCGSRGTFDATRFHKK
jgi:hypothetical protein